MQDVPKIVTDRLRAGLPVVNHPDADVLTAFSEGGLAKGERAIVLDHLAGCGDCREIVALALPPVEATQTVVRPAPAGWLSWPALRWGFVAVGVFAIASLGVVQYRKQVARSESMADVSTRSSAVKEARNEASPVPALAQSAEDREKTKVPASTAPAVAGKANPEGANSQEKEFDRLETFTNLQKTENKAKKAIVGHLGSSLGSPVVFGPRVQTQNAFNQNQNAYNLQANQQVLSNNVHGAPVAPQPIVKQPPNAFMDAGASAAPATQTIEAQAQSQQVEVQGRNPQPLRLEEKTLELQPTEGGQGHTVESANNSGLVVGVSRAKVPVSAPAAPGAFTGALTPPNASWTIAAGGLQRSLDQGKTWQNVNVNAPPAAGANLALTVQAVSEGDRKRDKDSSLRRAAVPAFHAVVANGPDVWAGGSSGLLYHSVDSGAHWIRVQPAAAGAVLTGDIVSLEFVDPQHGKVTTSVQEVWLTSDGGQSWQKQ